MCLFVFFFFFVAVPRMFIRHSLTHSLDFERHLCSTWFRCAFSLMYVRFSVAFSYMPNERNISFRRVPEYRVLFYGEEYIDNISANLCCWWVVTVYYHRPSLTLLLLMLGHVNYTKWAACCCWLGSPPPWKNGMAMQRLYFITGQAYGWSRIRKI